MLTQIIKPGAETPLTVTLEATWNVIMEQGLDWMEGEQFDSMSGVIAIDDDGTTVRIVTCRTHAAWKRGEPNAGRGEWEFTRDQLQCIYHEGNPIWGKPGHN
jgi:hypothetical protein